MPALISRFHATARGPNRSSSRISPLRALVFTALIAGLKVSATAPVKGLWLQSEGLEFEDNFIDLVPGDVRHIAVRGAARGPWSGLPWTSQGRSA